MLDVDVTTRHGFAVRSEDTDRERSLPVRVDDEDEVRLSRLGSPRGYGDLREDTTFLVWGPGGADGIRRSRSRARRSGRPVRDPPRALPDRGRLRSQDRERSRDPDPGWTRARGASSRLPVATRIPREVCGCGRRAGRESTARRPRAMETWWHRSTGKERPFRGRGERAGAGVCPAGHAGVPCVREADVGSINPWTNLEAFELEEQSERDIDGYAPFDPVAITPALPRHGLWCLRRRRRPPPVSQRLRADASCESPRPPRPPPTWPVEPSGASGTARWRDVAFHGMWKTPPVLGTVVGQMEQRLGYMDRGAWTEARGSRRR